MITYKTRNRLIALGIVAVVVIIIAVNAMGAYNRLVEKREEVAGALSQIDNQMQRRSDLIPNLVDAVKYYAAHETAVYNSIADARAKLSGADAIEELAQANAEVSKALTRLLAIAEAYPELEANRNFIQLQDELAGTENRIAVARRDYNSVVQEYNTIVNKFPTRMYASIMGFKEARYFEISDEAGENPDVGDIFKTD